MANGIYNDLTAIRHLRAPKLVTDTGTLLLQTYAGTTFNMLQFGGTTASYPALKRSGNTLQVRNADDSGYSDLTVGNLTITGTPIVANASAPSTASSTGVVGQIAYDSSYFYVCTAANTWVRTPLATW